MTESGAGWHQYWNQGSTYESGCTHKGVKHLFNIGKARIFAGSRSEVEKEAGWALIISLLGEPTTRATVTANAGARTLFPEVIWGFHPTPAIGVEWGDGSVPTLPKEWWDTLFEALKGVEGDVAVYCLGGHGRTGTFMAIMAAKLGLHKGGCPVKWVRKRYCAKAVETTSQILYVTAMTGVKVKALSFYAMKAAERAAEDKKRAAEEAAKKLLPPQAPEATSSGANSQGELPNCGGAPYGASGLDDEWVWDRESNGLIRRSELRKRYEEMEWGPGTGDSQDWEGSWHDKR